MQSFLGLVNFLNRYSVNLVELSKPLCNLCALHADNKVSTKHMEAFQAIKSVFSSKIILSYYDCAAHMTLQTYSSKKVLGSVFIRHGKSIYFASRSLTKAEENYQNLERETLSTISGMECFHYFLYGKKFTLETDQKPLASIYKKHVVDVSPQIQRPAIPLLPYNFQVVYVSSKNIPMADALSCVSPGKGKKNEKKFIKLPIIMGNLVTSAMKGNMLNEIRQETGKD